MASDYSQPDACSTSGGIRFNVRFAAVTVLLLIAFLDNWYNRFEMFEDGISYLEKGELLLSGELQRGISSYWSPAYSVLLGLSFLLFKPPVHLEFPLIHLVNFLIFVLVLFSFDRFLLSLRAYLSTIGRGISDRVLFLFGYSVFAVSYTILMRVSLETPDLLMSFSVFGASSILLNIKAGNKRPGEYLMLGLLLAAGYLTKAVMLPISACFFILSLFASGAARKGFTYAALAVCVFVLVVSPYVWCISKIKGYFTMGDAGKINYMWMVNQMHYLQFQEPAEVLRKTYNNPPERLYEDPIVNKFDTGGSESNPSLFDPSYWMEGASPEFHIGQQVSCIYRGLRRYFELFIYKQSFFILAVLVMLIAHNRYRNVLKDMVVAWPLLAPAVAGFLLYTFIAADYVSTRYTAPFNTLLWVGLFCGIYPVNPRSYGKVVTSVSIALSSIILLFLVHKAVRLAVYTNNGQFELAMSMKRLGIKEGDTIAVVGYGRQAALARLMRAQVKVEISCFSECGDAASRFWNSPNEVKSEIYGIMKENGVAAVIAIVPSQWTAPGDGWVHAGDMEERYYVRFLE